MEIQPLEILATSQVVVLVAQVLWEILEQILESEILEILETPGLQEIHLLL